jgi:hypothetical protein
MCRCGTLLGETDYHQLMVSLITQRGTMSKRHPSPNGEKDIGKVPTCEWCRHPMHKISNQGTGFLRYIADTWLCDNITCGHEREIIRSGLAVD